MVRGSIFCRVVDPSYVSPGSLYLNLNITFTNTLWRFLMRRQIRSFSLVSLPFAISIIGLYLFLMSIISLSQNSTAAAHPMAVVNACGTIASTTTWTPENLYVANNCDIVVNAGVTLTLPAGVSVKFGGASSALIVRGGLVVQGSQGDPVAITSLNDDDHGDMAPGSSGAPAAGDWYGIHFAAGSAGNIQHAFIGYAGSGGWNGAIGLWNAAQVRVIQAKLNMQYAMVDHGLRNGIYFEGAGLTPTLQHVQVSNNAGWASWPGSNAVYQDTINMQPTYSDLEFSGNDINAVVINSSHELLTQDVTLGGAVFSFVCGYTDCPVTIPTGLTLTVAPGTQLSFPAYSYRLAVQAGATLLAEGTPTQPITFTSILASSNPGDWQGIVIDSGATARLAYCDVSNGGRNSFGGLDLSATDVEVSNCHIHHNSADGVYLHSQGIAPSFTDVDVTDNGRYGIYIKASDTHLTFEGGSIQRNTQNGFIMYYLLTGGRPTFRDVKVNDNGGDGMFFNSHGAAPYLENVDFNGNIGAAVRWWAGTSPTFSNLSASGNGMDGLVNTGGDIWGGHYWAVAEAGLPVYMVGNANIKGGALLSIEPGTTLILTPTVNINNSEGGSLYALGTAEQPITFTGMTQTPGAWGYIDVGSTSTLFLSHCTVEYGGGYNASGYGMISTRGYGPKVIQNCRIRHSLGAGIKMTSGDSSPLLRNNEIYSNTTYGVLKTYGPTLDARYNWWGDPSGPYHSTQNPAGKGNAVGEYENVVFTPWLTEPPTQTSSLGKLIVDTGALGRISPGQTVEYAIQVYNGMPQTVENAVLMMQLPAAAEYVDSSHEGIYWPERDQVFWKLGDLSPNDNWLLSVRVRFQWGLQRDYKDGTITLLAGSNYRQPEMNVTQYLEYQPITLVDRTLLTEGEFAAERAAFPELQALYEQALAQGYSYFAAAHVGLDDGRMFTEAVMIPPDRQSTRLLTRDPSGSLAYTIDRNKIAVYDATGGMSMSLLTNQQTFWGSWQPDPALRSVLACTPGRCKANCLGQKITLNYVSKKAGRILAWTAFSFFTGGSGIPAAVWEVGSTSLELFECFTDCDANPNSYCCTGNQVRWTTGLATSLFNGCWKQECNPTTGQYGSSGLVYCTLSGQRCVAGMDNDGGCKDCIEGMGRLHEPAGVCAVDASGKSRCNDLALFVAKDPNAKLGPAGDLLPGQLVTYTIAYENEGAGSAYGVYVTDQLSEVFDADTLQIQSGGLYLPFDRTLVWMVGELDPKGGSHFKGEVTFNVRLRDDLPSGTVVRNQATVFFPSVPEETPTNPVINLIEPLAAVPQEVETNYHQPVAITLGGRSVDALPLTFSLVERPLAGSLTGTLPSLVYTPPENFTGVDNFSFIVSNGITASRPAGVRVVVNSMGDSTPPEVVWTDPAAGALDVQVSTEPLYTDEIGPVYPPILSLGFSESLSATTVTTQSVYLTKAGGSVAPSSVMVDNYNNQVILAPRAPLQSGVTYTVAATIDVRDIAGNPMAEPFAFSFTTLDLTPPEAAETSPADGAIGVSLDAPIVITFTESISQASLNLVLTPSLEMTFTWNAAGTVVTAAHAPFAETTTYSATVMAEDLAGNKMTQAEEWSFTTGEFTPPAVVQVSPAYGAIDVPLDAPIIITFTEPIAPASLNLILTPPLAMNATWNAAGTVATVTHAPFTGKTSYAATVLNGVADLAGNVMVDEYIWHFSTLEPDYSYIYLPLILRTP